MADFHLDIDNVNINLRLKKTSEKTNNRYPLNVQDGCSC